MTGICLWSYETDMPDGTRVGWDADYGPMYAYKGKVVCESDLPKEIEKNNIKN